MDYQPNKMDRDAVELKRILVVDDAAEARLTLSLRLQREGFLVSTAANGPDALRILEAEGLPHLVILDIMMPEMDGFAFANELQRFGDIPIIFVTAVTDTDTKIEGITQFAEDYVTKPFDFLELVARIRRVLSRSLSEQSLDPELVIDDNLSVNFSRQYAVVDGKQITLTPTENRILRTLYSNRGRVISPTFLLSKAWDPTREGTVESLWVHVRRLRSKIEDDPNNPRYVTTVRGQGYCLPQNMSKTPIDSDNQ